MRCAPRLLSLLLVAVVGFATSPARAQTRSLDIERYRPAPDREGFLAIPGTRTPGEWAWNANLVLGYQAEPLTIRRIDDPARIPVVAHRVGADLIAQLGIFDRAAAVLYVPVVLWQDANPGALGGPAISAVAFRDPYLAARVRILGEGADGDHSRNEGEGLGVQVGLTLPFGLEDNFAGEGEPQLDAAIVGDFHFLDFAIGGTVGYRHRFAEPELLGIRFANELFFGVAIQVPTVVIPNLAALVEVRVTTALDQVAFADASTAFEGEVGARWAEDDIALTWALGMGFNGGVGVPAVRGVFGIEFAPRTHDADGDGLVDGADGCANLPEDMDGFEDEDGCPDPDNDGDLIPDADDRCPLEASDFDHDEDEDGCTDPVRDSDGDGVEDGEDACPNEAEDLDDFDDEDGCPDLDDDGDGVADSRDRCRREPEDADGFEDEDGCPDVDNDGDSIADVDDRCPSETEDADDFEDEDGCPDLDNDRDGVPDASDACPEPETINGVDDEDGCPDEGGRARWTEEDGVLLGTVRFSGRSGVLYASARGSVDQLAAHLRARGRSEVAIATEREESRAALTAALVERGVPSEAFTVVSDPELAAHRVQVRAVPAP